MEEPVAPVTETPPVVETPAIETPPIVEIADPGQLEGKSKHEPPVGSPRWNEVYHKAKETERLLEQEREERAGIAGRIAELEEQNRQLIETRTAPPAAPLLPATPPPQDLNVLLQQMKAVRGAAYRDMDMEKLAQVQDDIDTLIMQMSKPAPEQIMGTFRQMEQDKEVNVFVQNTSWFNPTLPNGTRNPEYDPIMEGAAINLEKQLLPSWKGTYGNLLAEVKKQVEERLGKKPPTRPSMPGVGVVGGAIPVGASPAKLSPDQQRVARMMFSNHPDPEKVYLESLSAGGR